MRSLSSFLKWGALVLLGLTGCPDGDAAGPGSNGSVSDSEAPGLDHEGVELPVRSAAMQRLAVEQLRRSLAIALGDRANGEPVGFNFKGRPLLDEFSEALGEPDYLNTTQESLDPSPLYSKLVDDMARTMCGQAVDHDRNLDEGESATIMRFVGVDDIGPAAAEKVAENLRYLKLRLHAVYLAPDDAEAIVPYAVLFDALLSAASEGEEPTKDDVALAWTALCSSMVMAPEFHLY